MATGGLAGKRRSDLLCRCRPARPREIKAEGTAVPNFAVDRQMATRLLGKTVDHAKAEACSFAGWLGGEERLHDSGQDLRRYSGSVVCHVQGHEFARGHFPLRSEERRG